MNKLTGPLAPFAMGALLSEYRLLSGLRQSTVAEQSGLGSKSVSAYETGYRTETIKFKDLVSLLNVYGVSLAQFESDVTEYITRLARRRREERAA